MPDIPNRDDFETEVARILGRLGSKQRKRVLKLLGNPPDLSKLTPEFWSAAGTELSNALRPLMTEIYLEAAQRVVEASPIGVDWALVNTDAVTWVQQYVFELSTQISDTTQTSLQRFISGFFEEPVPMRELRDQLGQLFGPVRADMIAQTEVTRAAAQGELSVARELEKEGVRMERIWITNNDEIVRRCPVCFPLHEEPETVWRNTSPNGPPAHPRCRCWLNLEFRDG